MLADLMFTSSLFMTKATPAEADGFLVALELYSEIFLSKRVLIWSADASVRWDSWMARTSIFFFRIMFITNDHLEKGPAPIVRDEWPLVFREVIVMLALYFQGWGLPLFMGLGAGGDFGGVVGVGSG